MLEILSYLQERQPPIIHRDIKPSNILDQMTAPDPSNRPASAVELLDDIAALRSTEVDTSSESPIERSPNGEVTQQIVVRRRTLKFLPYAALLMLIILGLSAPGTIPLKILAFIFIVLPIGAPAVFILLWILSPNRIRARLRTPGLHKSKRRLPPVDDTERRRRGVKAAHTNKQMIRSSGRGSGARGRQHDVQHQQRHRHGHRKDHI